jgi:hypothetical protein
MQCSPAFSFSEVQIVRYKNVNFNSIDCSFGAICTRWRRLGIQSLARLTAENVERTRSEADLKSSALTAIWSVRGRKSRF